MEQVEIAVVGGGASGLMAALTAAEEQKKQRRPVSVWVLEGAQKPGRKLLATGNGRCNLTNTQMSLSRYHGETEEARAVLKAWPPQAVIHRFRTLGLVCREEEEGRVYPNSGQAAAVLELFLRHLEGLGVQVRCGWHLRQIQKKGAGFVLFPEEGEPLTASRVILAAGGQAAPKLGADGSGVAMARALGHSCTPCRPALTPVRCQKKQCRALQGMRCRGKVSLLADGRRVGEETGEIQFTEYGLSGICVFQLSRLAAEWEETGRLAGRRVSSLVFSLDLTPDMTEQELEALLRQRQRLLPHIPAEEALDGLLNLRVGQQIIREALGEGAGQPLGRITAEACAAVARLAKQYEFPVAGVMGWERAQVTAGGVPLSETDPATLESRCCPGLYLCGELLDVDGDCGGYNLHWAWASGITAGKGATRRDNDSGKQSQKKKPGAPAKGRRSSHAAHR